MKLTKMLDDHESDLCPASLAWTLSNPFRNLIHPPEKILSPFIKPGQTVADFGCGPGHFTLPMCSLVGPNGKVFAIDLQKEMLAIVTAKSRQSNLDSQLQTIQVETGDVQLPVLVDFGLAFWMIHEVKNQNSFMENVFRAVKPGGQFLLVEPRLHVSGEHFKLEKDLARQAGFIDLKSVSITISRAELFQKS
jgi:ubiquinone/menaquinone biosynthesis C-methylase UbiE